MSIVQYGDLRVLKIDANKSKTVRIISVNNDGSCIIGKKLLWQKL
tara:strand:+ start:663 stop:797 length:135 start_codon:yes stop_codon:yes gene_type:complete